MQKFLSIVQYLRFYKLSAAANILFNVLSVVFSLVSLTMIFPFLYLLFDRVEAVSELPNFSWSSEYLKDWVNYQLTQLINTRGKSKALLLVCYWVVVVFFLKNLCRYAAMYFMAGIRNGVVKRIRNQLFSQVLQLPIAFFSEEKKGDIITRLTADVQEIEYSIVSVLEVTFREPITIVIYLLSMLFISPQLCLFVFLVLPITGLIIGRIGRSLRKKSHQAQQQLAEIMGIIDETISGLRIIKAFTAEQQQNERFKYRNQRHYSIAKSMLRRRDLSSPLSEFLSISVVALVLYVGGQMVLKQSANLHAEAFIYFMLVFSQLIPPAKSFSTAYYNIQKGIASVERIQKILTAQSNITEIPKPQSLSYFKEIISFKNVCFAYKKNQIVLNNINFTLKKGKVLALVGSSGAGKSTLVDLIPRFYDVDAGQILIDGQDIRHYKIKDLRNLMGMVSQEPILFNDTIFNNISFGLTPLPSQEQIVAAAKVANAHQFISQLPQGYQTNIGDRGQLLSGGERQRLTIARAVLKNPQILILDEATSSLDANSEQLVQDALLKLMKNRTSIVIAHRLSTIQFADEIMVLQNGSVVEQGTHEQLMQLSGGIYQNMVALQQLKG